MATLIRQTEAPVEEYQHFPGVGIVPQEAVWERLESYIAWRYSVRDVVWTVEGPGEWLPPLVPYTISTVETWSRGAHEWDAATLDPSPFGGYFLPCSGPYRFTGTAGDNSLIIPHIVVIALTRLQDYMAAKCGKPGAMSESISLGEITETTRRDPAWMGMALQNSGAADLLRAYRRA